MESASDLQAERIVDYSSVAALAFLIWDVLITLDDEVEYIWRKPNRYWAKWLYLFVRYFAVMIQIALLFVGTEIAASLHYGPHACVSWYIFQEVTTQVLIASVEIILMIRVHALYDRNRAVTATLLLLFLAENITMIATLVAVAQDVQMNSYCVVLHTPHRLLLFAIAFVLFETMLFILTLFKFIRAFQTGWGRTPVITLLMRDGTWAFALIFATLCVNGAFYLGTTSPLTSVAFPWLISIEAFAGSRLILNMQTLDSGDEPSSTVLSSRIEFSSAFADDAHVRTRPPARRTPWDAMMGLGPPGSGGDWTRMGLGARSPGTADTEFEMTPTNSDATTSSAAGVQTVGRTTIADALEEV
ncbi:hypothetical protein FA95DRAFT_1038106 [Auriscalpium vulgare]|uniref:Uncharacterized protein n=1 Tax=Auriscalpium vulgare TaxID=40419 RepID=A0ACB8RW19_9AGAM|nr:hypothetical protein FA95DRAFT_1038106 [Auriscalpium vulgare]